MELDKNAVENEAIKTIVDRLIGSEYSSDSLIRKVRDAVLYKLTELVARKMAERYYEANEIELFKLLDNETIAKVATLKLISKLADKIGQ